MEISFLLLNTSAGELLIDTHTIVRVEAMSNYSRLYFNDGKTLVTAKLLKWFEKKLPHVSFVRLHRSHLVNNQYLRANQLISDGLILYNGEFIRLSRRRRKEILNRLQAA